MQMMMFGRDGLALINACEHDRTIPQGTIRGLWRTWSSIHFLRAEVSFDSKITVWSSSIVFGV